LPSEMRDPLGSSAQGREIETDSPPPGHPSALRTTNGLCGNCGAEMPAGYAFCGKCGVPLQAKSCRACGAALLEGFGFCGKCGTRSE
jgi:predicted amidophosphoribosyltransferase